MRIPPIVKPIVAAALLAACAILHAGGPKYVAGTTYFNPAAVGQPLHWPGGQVSYYVDQGPLNSTVSNPQATAMVDAAAAIWNAVSTAGVALTDKGELNEDVSGANVTVNSAGQMTAPADVTPDAAAYPVAILYDADGSIIDALYGSTASDPTACNNNGVIFWLDNFQPDATFAHGIIVLNGRCATTPGLLTMMQFQLERAFGRILGLDFSQINPGALQSSDPNQLLGWPVMQPASGACGVTGGDCIPSPTTLRFDDIAALSRLYPITAKNLAQFPGKQLTAPNTVALTGSVSFSNDYGMQGVNVVARPLNADGHPLYQYTVSAVTGALFSGKHGNPVTGYSDTNGNPLSNWGSNDSLLQGNFDLSGIPLPPGMTSATYQISFEAVDPMSILENSVGPYLNGQVSPSGQLNSVDTSALNAGSAQQFNLIAENSAIAIYSDAIATSAAPRSLPATGFWSGRLSQVQQSDWFTFPVRGNRTFTIVAQALNETGTPANSKAMPTIGVWDALDSPTAPAVATGPALNGIASGETWLRVRADADDVVRIAITDQRGDGRPDFSYDGWVLYADSVEPSHLPVSGGPIVIHGIGFHSTDSVLVNGQPALITSISPTEITTIAPPAAPDVSGSVDVQVNDAPAFFAAAIISGGLSYDAGNRDALNLVTAPANTVPINTPLPFTVTALQANLVPAAGVSVSYAVTSGTAQLGCGASSCTVTATGDGRATMSVTAIDSSPSVVTASLTNGAILQAHFSGGTPPTLTALTPQLSVAAGATVTWTVQALALLNGSPAANQSVVFSSGSGIAVAGSAGFTTNTNGLATATLTVGPLSRSQLGSIQACLNGAAQCVTFTALGARPEYASLESISGTRQSLSPSVTPAQIALRLLDMNGNPMAGGTVSLYQSLYAWTPPCSSHVPCAEDALLAEESATATSAIDGSVTFSPASLPGVSTRLQALALSGDNSTVSIAIDQH